jgi:hypothetical protein
MNQNFAVHFTGRPYGYFNVLAERGEKIHEALDRKGPGLAPHERGDVWLLDAEDFTRLHLGEVALLNQAVDAQRQMRLELLAFRVRKSEIGKNVAAASPDLDFASLFHGQFCLSL